MLTLIAVHAGCTAVVRFAGLRSVAPWAPSARRPSMPGLAVAFAVPAPAAVAPRGVGPWHPHVPRSTVRAPRRAGIAV